MIRGSSVRGQRSAFTLLELLIYIAILAVAVVMLVGVFLSLNRGQGQVSARSEVDSNLRFAIDKIRHDLWAASAVATPSGAGNSSTTLSITVSGSAVTYCVSGGQLRRQVVGNCTSGSEPITAADVVVSSPLFTRLENTNTVLGKTVVSVKVSLTASYNSASPDYQYSETKQTTTALRY